MSKIDKLSLLRGKPYVVNDDIQLRQPSISEITEYGGDAYLALVSTITGTSYDFRFQLFDGGIDYEDVDDFTMFSMIFPTLTKEEASVIFGELDPSKFSIQLDADNNYFFLANPDGVRIDAIIYQLIVDYLRAYHGLKRNFIHFGNEMARKFHMEEERELLKKKSEQETDSGQWLESLISAMVNCDGFKYNYDGVWQLTFYQFMDAVKRIQKINEFKNLSTGIYTGNIDTEKMGTAKLREQMNWLGEL